METEKSHPQTGRSKRVWLNSFANYLLVMLNQEKQGGNHLLDWTEVQTREGLNNNHAGFLEKRLDMSVEARQLSLFFFKKGFTSSFVIMSDDDSVQQHRNKTMVFTLEERKLILRLVNMHYDVVNNKKVDSASTQLKNQAWDSIHKEYLAHTTLVRLPRTPQQLKRCWENMKCKAKRGDRMSVSLMRWGEMQYRAQQGEGKWVQNQKRLNGSLSGLDLTEEESETDLKDENNPYEAKTKSEEIQNANNSFDNNILQITQDLENGSCVHCNCDKNEKSARIQLLTLERQQNQELHQLKMQMIKDRNKREKELHKMAVHEMSLKIENERRRAEILEKELGN